MTTELIKLRREVERRQGQRDRILSDIRNRKISLRQSHKRLRSTEKARAILQTVAKMTQDQLQYHINDVVSLALNSIFEEPYEFELEFVTERGKTAAELWFTKMGEKVEPMSASGGGAVDVAAFALRVALWRISATSTRPVLVLDEPFRFLSRELQPKAGELLREISKKLKLQIIMVTHSGALGEEADKTFTVTQRDGISKVED